MLLSCLLLLSILSSVYSTCLIELANDNASNYNINNGSFYTQNLGYGFGNWLASPTSTSYIFLSNSSSIINTSGNVWGIKGVQTLQIRRSFNTFLSEMGDSISFDLDTSSLQDPFPFKIRMNYLDIMFMMDIYKNRSYYVNDGFICCSVTNTQIPYNPFIRVTLTIADSMFRYYNISIIQLDSGISDVKTYRFDGSATKNISVIQFALEGNDPNNIVYFNSLVLCRNPMITTNQMTTSFFTTSVATSNGLFSNTSHLVISNNILLVILLMIVFMY